jgi:hypothetical protein
VNKRERERERAGCHIISPAPLSAWGQSPQPANPVCQPDLCIHACEDSVAVTELILACTCAHTHMHVFMQTFAHVAYFTHIHFGV